LVRDWGNFWSLSLQAVNRFLGSIANSRSQLMRLAYLTHDEVNQALAGPLAAAAGLELDLRNVRDGLDHGDFDGVLYDLDFLPADFCARVLADLMARPPKSLAAVHGYNLTARQRRALWRRGVIVARRLRARLFRQLKEAAERLSLHQAGPPTYRRRSISLDESQIP
jgi:hypothetical protein